jgi:hypothetical protein
MIAAYFKKISGDTAGALNVQQERKIYHIIIGKVTWQELDLLE